MKDKFRLMFNLSFQVFTLAMFIIILTSSILNFGRTGYNQSYLIFSAVGSGAGLIISVALIVLEIVKFKKKETGGILKLGHIAETPAFEILSSPTVRIGILIVWALFIGTLASQFNIQVWGDSNPYIQYTAFSTNDQPGTAYSQMGFARSLWDSAVVPGYNEDISTFGLSVAIVMLQMLVLTWIYFATKNPFFKPLQLRWIIPAVIVGCIIASLGLGFIPGFAQAHETVGGTDVLFLLSAFVFQTINLLLFWVTGLFFPLAHIIHNAMFVIGFSIAYSFAFCLIPIMSKEKLVNFLKLTKEVICAIPDYYVFRYNEFIQIMR